MESSLQKLKLLSYNNDTSVEKFIDDEMTKLGTKPTYDTLWKKLSSLENTNDCDTGFLLISASLIRASTKSPALSKHMLWLAHQLIEQYLKNIPARIRCISTIEGDSDALERYCCFLLSEAWKIDGEDRLRCESDHLFDTFGYQGVIYRFE